MKRRGIGRLSLVLFSVLVAGHPKPVAGQSSRARRAERLLEAYHDLRLFNGAALIVDEGEVLFRGAFGEADFENEIPNQAETRFSIPTLPGLSGLEHPGTAPDTTSGTEHAIGYAKKLRGYRRTTTVEAHTLEGGLREEMLDVTVDDLAHLIGREDSAGVFEISGDTLGVSWFVRSFTGHDGAPDGTIVLLDNTSSNLAPLAEGLTHLLQGSEVSYPRPSIAERLLPVIEAAGVAPALARYRDWKRTRPKQYDYGPEELMRLARHFLEADDPESAVMILEADVEEFPSCPLAGLVLAEMDTAAGEPERAVSRLEAALLGSPGEPAVLEALLALGAEPSSALRSPIREVAVEALTRLVGEYRIDPSTTLDVRLEEGGLTAARTGEAAFPLLPQSETTFLLEGSEIQMIFQVESDEAAAVSILESGQRVTFPRVPPAP